MSFSPSWVHATIAATALLSPLAGLIFATWRRSKRNEEKLDLLLRSLGVDPEEPRLDLDPSALTEGERGD